MYINSALMSEFDRVTAPVRLGGVDLPDVVRRLDAAATAAVPSLLGWSLTVRVDGANVTLTSVDPALRDTVVRASFRIPLTAFLTAGRDGGMVFYGGAPYAFSRLNNEFLPGLCTGRRQSGIDQDLDPDLVCGLSGVRQMSTINRAIGFLLSGGETADLANLHLQSLAASAHTTVHQAAQALLGGFPAPVLAEV